MLRIATVLAVLGGALATGAVQAQSVFGGSPPRPPADIPSGPFPPQPPPVQFPGQSPQQPVAPPPARAPSAIQSQPLPTPPGTSVAPVPVAAPDAGLGQRARPMPQPANPPPPQPADTSVKPDDIVTIEMPAQKIENARAVFAGLDKITGRIISFDAAVGETVQFGALRVTARICYTRPPTETPNTDAFVEVDEVTLQGEIKRIFTGWMFASSPGLHAVEHPIYDVWLTDCAAPAPTRVAEPAVQPTPPTTPASPAPPRPRQAAHPRQQQPVAPSYSPPPPPR